ncbi:hypothetical protein Mapa_012454 [Marchantia paleacea]|nr:hypothetical protein Mapa_012454 [Marchantia paleacea]
MKLPTIPHGGGGVVSDEFYIHPHHHLSGEQATRRTVLPFTLRLHRSTDSLAGAH